MALTKSDIADIVKGIKSLIQKVKGMSNKAETLPEVDAMVAELEGGLRAYIKDNAEKISFTAPLYSISQIEEGHYQININITGLGTQQFQLLMMGDDFLFKGKLAVIGTGASFPFSLVAALVNNAFKKWITQTAEDVAKDKAIRLAKKHGATSTLEAQVSNVKQILPEPPKPPDVGPGTEVETLDPSPPPAANTP